jgi:NADH-quinone oxidoreductase subunit N
VAFPGAAAAWEPFVWVLSALTMTVGNVLALRQRNVVRLIAYSSVSQGGFVLMPLAVAGSQGDAALRAVVTYLLAYAASNLGVFAIVLAVSRRTGSGDVGSFAGLFSWAPALGVLMTIFLASLAGIPPLGGWIGKFAAFQALLGAGTPWAYALAVVGAVNTAVAFGYYGSLMREIWMRPAPAEGVPAAPTPPSLSLALGLTAVATLVVGVLPGTVLRLADLATFAGALGS